MSLQQQIADDLRAAMKARDRERMSALRLLVAAVKNKAVEVGLGPQGELSDEQVQQLVASETKRRKEAADAFRDGGREESAAKEDYEAEVYSAYLPAQLDDDELEGIIDRAIEQVGASDRSDMGKVMGQVMGEVGQAADGRRVSAMVGGKLS